MGVQSSASLKRLNHLQCEMSVVYHEMSLSVGQSDSVIQFYIRYVTVVGKVALLHDLCNLTGLPKQTINSAIRKLEQEHILYLESTGSRNKRVILTEKGKQLAAKTAGKAIAAENRIFEEVGSEEAEKFLALNERYLKCLRSKS